MSPREAVAKSTATPTPGATPAATPASHTKVADVRSLVEAGRRDPSGVFPQIERLAADDAWQTREVAATALVEIAKRQPRAVLAQARRWARAADPNVRRAASEGLRGLVKEDPDGVRAVLELLRADPAPYVRKSVANVLRNASARHPAMVLSTCREWARSPDAGTRWIVREGLRKLASTTPAAVDEVLALMDTSSPAKASGTGAAGRRAPTAKSEVRPTRGPKASGGGAGAATGADSATEAAAPLFAGRAAVVRETYERLAAAVGRFGPVTAEAKKTSIHLVAGADGGAFAGVHPRKAALLLTIRSATPLSDARVRKVDQVSRHRFHNDVLLTAPTDVDGELLGWLRSAYELASGST